MDGGSVILYPEWLLTGNPFEVQQVADHRAGFRKGYNWWLEQGLGKTATALQNWMRWRRRTNGPRATRLIIVTLNSMRQTWPQEIRQWCTEKLDIEVWPENPHKNPDVFVVNYESLAGQGRGWGAGYDRALALAQGAPTMLVIDEAHRIKDPGSRWSRCLWDLAKDCVARRCLTGTPMSQSVMDLYPALRMGGEVVGTNPVVFRNRYAKRGGYMGNKIIGFNDGNKPELDEMMDRCSFRALKADWTDLPEKMPPTIIPLNLPKELVPHYRSMLQDFVVELDSRDPDDPIVAKMVVTQMGKLQQISSGFIYDENKEGIELLPMAKLPKYMALKDILEGMDSKMLVFCHFRPTASALIEQLIKDFGECSYMVGGMKPDQIEEQKARFNSDGGPRIKVAQISVGSAGHTLLGGPTQACYTTAFFENNFVLTDREQSMDRNHRFGQKMPVSYYDFTSTAIERQVIAALQAKKSLVQAVIDSRGYIQGEFKI